MDILIREVRYDEMDLAFNLIWNTFLEFVAPDYNQEGIDTFKNNFIENKAFKILFKNGKQFMYGAFFNKKLVGVISISINNTISCVFVDKEFHRKGIATMLFNHIVSDLKEKQVDKISLNASPYAIPFYHAIGFKDLAEQQDYHGIIYTPMEFILGI